MQEAILLRAVWQKQYAGSRRQQGKDGSQKIQDAHEAIRPTDVTRTPAMLKESLSRDQFRLYQLIWKRFVASRMMPAVYETTSVKIGSRKISFHMLQHQRLHLKDSVWFIRRQDEEKDEKSVLLKGLDEDTVNFLWNSLTVSSILHSRRHIIQRRLL